MIGTVITIEFFLTTAVSGPFLTALPTGHWDQPEELATHAWAVAGLIDGAFWLPPLAGFVLRIIPALLLMVLVGIVIMSLAACQVVRLH